MTIGVDVIQNLIQLGSIAKTTAARVGPGATWVAVLAAIAADPALSKSVGDLYGKVKGRAAIDAALQSIRKEEGDILRAANAEDASGLSGRKLLNYHHLAEAELQLATRKLANALDDDFLSWLIDTALPSLTKVLPLLLAL